MNAAARADMSTGPIIIRQAIERRAVPFLSDEEFVEWIRRCVQASLEGLS